MLSHNDLPARVLRVCERRGWSLDWTARGAYLHLESSELIEALRGKRGDPLCEAADVLFVLMSITEHNGIPWSGILDRLEQLTEELTVKPRYPGESYEGSEDILDSGD